MEVSERRIIMVEEAANLYGVKEQWLRDQCFSGALRATKINRRWFIKIADLDKFFNGEKNVVQSGRKKRRA